VVYGALVEFVGFTCPLTPLENYLRHRAGEAGYRGGFIAHYLVKAIYPPGLTRGMQTGLGVLVLLIAITGYGGFLRRHAGGLTGDGAREPALCSDVRRQQAGVEPPRPHRIRCAGGSVADVRGLPTCWAGGTWSWVRLRLHGWAWPA
jgi:hypothetical protein